MIAADQAAEGHAVRGRHPDQLGDHGDRHRLRRDRCTPSISPRSDASASRPSTIAVIRGSSPATVRGVNARLTSLRSRVWSGGSRLISWRASIRSSRRRRRGPMQLVADVGMPQTVEDIPIAGHDPEALARRRIDLRHRLAGRPHARVERVPVRANLRFPQLRVSERYGRSSCFCRHGSRDDRVARALRERAGRDERVGRRGDGGHERGVIGERRLVPDDVQERQAVVARRRDPGDRDVVVGQVVVALGVGHAGVDRAEHDVRLDPPEVRRVRLRVADVVRPQRQRPPAVKFMPVDFVIAARE